MLSQHGTRETSPHRRNEFDRLRMGGEGVIGKKRLRGVIDSPALD